MGQRIKMARRARKRSQDWLGAEVGVNQSSVSQWEHGQTEPTSENLSRIADVLRISYEWLATGRGEMELSFSPVELHIAEPLLDDDQRELLALFEQLPRGKRSILMQFMRDWINK
ncbi:helix-turn-helix domain-containing protein [Chromobacterium sp. ATCC 53434]|uniref:helix-turn-helix domain-containing protein n=1 Tax=Chromobacterium sp. (strain ATCC 53434 / SC 14030) TaxID=2059672 RepID=UPI0013054347|nr:helix-turn-helix domain-containing protein [Chromobacterium sp. ATCC 53434]